MSGSAAAASYPGAHPRYPTAGSGAPFGGLGGIIPPPVTASHLGSHTPRPAHPAYPAYPGVHHGLKEKEEAERRAKERREAEERERDRERERRHREEVQQARDSEARASREGFPAYVREVREVRERDKNGEERERDRSPVRGEAGAESGGQQSLQGVDMRVTPTSRPPSSLSQDPANLVKSAGGTDLLTKKEVRCKDDVYTHLYTLVVQPDGKYEVLIDNEKVESGSLEDDWDFLPPKEIKVRVLYVLER